MTDQIMMIMIRVITITRTFKHDDVHNDGHDEDKSTDDNIESAEILRTKPFWFKVNLVHETALENTEVYVTSTSHHPVPEPVLRALLVGAWGAFAGGSSWNLWLV